MLIGVWLATSACSCWGILDNPRGARDAQTSPPTVTATNTRVPTYTPYPTRPTRTTVPAKPEPTPVLDDLSAIPTEPNTPFAIEMTQAKLNEYLIGETFQAQGVTVRDVRIVLAPSGLICSFQASQQESGLNVGVTVRGMPTASEGVAYFRVDDVTLDDSLKGFNRLIVKAAIKSAIKEYSTPLGIPIPVDDVEFHRIELMRGKVLIVGRTR